ncbi:MAG: HD domain-containing protein, partial [Deltaproteobacteria bacterium]
FLHDIGKLHELSSQPGFEYTDEGRLLGHLVMGAQMMHELAGGGKRLNPELLVQLEHMILSHHGSYEFGSPKRPKTREALVLHYLDELDAKLQAFQQVSDQESRNRWSSYQRLFDRYLLLSDPKLDDSEFFAAQEAADTQPDAGGDIEPLKSNLLANQLGKIRNEGNKDKAAQLSLEDVAGSRKDRQ